MVVNGSARTGAADFSSQPVIVSGPRLLLTFTPRRVSYTSSKENSSNYTDNHTIPSEEFGLTNCLNYTDTNTIRYSQNSG